MAAEFFQWGKNNYYLGAERYASGSLFAPPSFVGPGPPQRWRDSFLDDKFQIVAATTNYSLYFYFIKVLVSSPLARLAVVAHSLRIFPYFYVNPLSFEFMHDLPKRISNPKKFSITKHETEYKGKDLNKDKAQSILDLKSKKLAELQEVFYADGRWSLLVILQGMDGSGKDSCVKRIFSGINPQGCHVVSFKAPTSEDLKHDFLWRCSKQLPEQGKIGIFNRSYYEEVLVVRAYKNLLAAENLPKEHTGKDIWKNRFEDINNFEKYLSRNGVRIIKFYLNISKKEQAERLLKRALDKEKHWKVGEHDMQINKDYKKFIDEIDDMMLHTSTKHAPWHIIPADDKWYAQLLMMNVILDEMKSLKVEFPKPTAEQLKAIAETKKILEKK